MIDALPERDKKRDTAPVLSRCLVPPCPALSHAGQAGQNDDKPLKDNEAGLSRLVPVPQPGPSLSHTPRLLDGGGGGQRDKSSMKEPTP